MQGSRSQNAADRYLSVGHVGMEFVTHPGSQIPFAVFLISAAVLAHPLSGWPRCSRMQSLWASISNRITLTWPAGSRQREGFPISGFWSPDPNSLATGIGSIDFVMFCAVYEHLLPAERSRLMPLIWSHVNNPGVIFLTATPFRWFPYEHHTTGLWFINYLSAWRCL